MVKVAVNGETSRGNEPGSRTAWDPYDLTRERLLLGGAQAVVRLLLMQKERDRRAGLKTAGFISGYRGSPLGGLDLQFVQAKKHFDAQDIHFQPGLNEDLAATAVWGAQQAGLSGEGRFDGVFSLWYAKGPGVDRSGDALRHANLAGTASHGGVLALAGDDHTAESSSTAYQSEFAFIDAMIPVLAPANVQEILDYGLLGLAMSRFTGTWVAMKCVKEIVQATSTVNASLDRIQPVLPTDYRLPPGGLGIRAGDIFLAQDERLQTAKQEALRAFLRANRLDRLIFNGGEAPRIGLIASGKTYLDLRQGLVHLGIENEDAAAELGLRLYKVGCSWPLEPQGLRAFANGLDLIIVIEEKRALIEMQARDILYGMADHPFILGKQDRHGNSLFPASGAYEASDIALAIGDFLLDHGRRGPAKELLAHRLETLRQGSRLSARFTDVAQRLPGFCAGCPHNRSTQVPDGMRAYAGIGCHFMALGMDRSTQGFAHMGAEGANWIGEAPFSRRGHIIQNLGDGTYTHSGLLAIRFAVAAGVDITYKILFNDAVAMTGGQRLEGGPTVDRIARQLAAEGVAQIAVVTDEPEKYTPGIAWPAGVTIEPRQELDAVQRRLATLPGVTVLLYDQTCATEKRRRGKRAKAAAPSRRVFINELLCEGCGDCGLVSNCVAIQPKETEFGRKRTIDQSSCNQDFSCLEGFCPALVSVEGVQPKRIADTVADLFPALPQPSLPVIGDRPFGIIVTGIGGTGVVTIGALLGVAAHFEGKICGINDMAGLAQKGGAVFSHVRIAQAEDQIHAIRIGQGEADLVLGCDLVATASRKILTAIVKGKTAVLVNDAEILPGDFARDADYHLPAQACRQALLEAAGDGVTFIEATNLATALFGQSLAANLFLLGHAWQQGLVPLAENSILAAIALNGQAVAMNEAAFLWGRRAAAHPASVAAIIVKAQAKDGGRILPVSTTLDQIVSRRAAFLTAYQDEAYAERYLALVEQAIATERRIMPGCDDFSKAVARNYFKLLAIKDEYEVGRLYSDGSFARQIGQTFEGEPVFTFYLRHPLWRRRVDEKGAEDKGKGTGNQPAKISLGPWMLPVFRLLARLKVVRGTAFDLFGYQRERREERQMLADYESTIADILSRLTPVNHSVAVALAALPEKIRGFGPVRERHRQAAQAEEALLMRQLAASSAATTLAAAE
ncbi:indolepyruvate ferredoxin oxidoreductase family protein [Beijerinckia indica]|uniref:Pyruvate ferredoxin/flavodoxin oxidoreductase n=1 Tax=Beijerinckia indica subsp. indica (strain ATCC 9039 / DSM 1715 / NCIMB 8712) TaxID=395963 RepID=B2IB42_BEII9|nr:indolepyruvate ferredoxin oxidoreductase family protein [Beijerinckia indica]ACB93742.1 pyruvate ferredoxin/flavodoxin oxidoreductase [Beijerinckia indica subsp. indica ATCC 9039]